MKIDLSIVVPVYNESRNIEIVYNKLNEVLKTLHLNSEVIFVDDGSKDDSFELLKGIASRDNKIKIIQFSRNFGQTAALAAGIKYANGEIIIPMDSDNQNDPEDIPRFLKKMEEGYDVVSGWRKDRKDSLLSRRVPSVLANKLISFITGVKLHDYGCTMKAYRKELIKGINLYGEMHRLIPVYAFIEGAKVTEIIVKHNQRMHEKSKYGISRTFKVILDLIVVKFLLSYSTKPIYLFGFLGLLSLLLGVIVGLYTMYARYILQIIGLNLIPLVLLTMLLLQTGLIFLLMGLLAEISIRTYHESQNKTVYRIKRVILGN